MRKLTLFVMLFFLAFLMSACKSEKKILVVFNTNGGSTVEDIELSNKTTSVNFPETNFDGFSFKGWFLDANFNKPFTIEILQTQKGDLTLYAKWEVLILNQTISFDEKGGTDITNITQAVGSVVVAPSPPTKAGFTFLGWFINENIQTPYTFSVMPEQALTLYARWESVVLNQTILFDEKGGTDVTNITQEIGSVVTAPNPPTKQGFTFLGWFINENTQTPYTFSVMPETALTLYARWESVVLNQTILFDEKGGTDVTNITQEVGSVVTAPNPPTKQGFTFLGWFINENIQTPYTFSVMPENALTLYARWESDGLNQTIIFDEKGGTEVTNITQEVGSVVTAPNPPTKAGFTFLGWFINENIQTPYIFSVMPETALTLYARWEAYSETITIAQFKQGIEGQTYSVQAIVVMTQFADGPMFVADDTGLLFIVATLPLQVGQEVLFEITLAFDDGFPCVSSQNGVINYEILADNIANPLTPEEIIIDEELYNLNVENKNNWGRYVEITGYIGLMEDDPYYPMLGYEDSYIVINPLYLYHDGFFDVFASNEEFGNYQGFRVSIKGFLFPDFEKQNFYEPNYIFLVPVTNSIVLDYQTEQEKMDALIAYEDSLFDNHIYRPYDYLNLLDSIPALDATIVWGLVSPNHDIFDFDTLQIQATEIQQNLIFNGTITIGSLVYVYEYTFQVYPYEFIWFEDFYNLRDGEFGKLEAIVAEVILGYGVILQESYGGLYLFAYGFDELNEGDVIEIFGIHVDDSGVTKISGYDPLAYVTIIEPDHKYPLVSWEGSLPVLATRTLNSGYTLRYYEIKGHLIYNDVSENYYLTNGYNTIRLILENENVFSTLESMKNQDIKVFGFNYQYSYSEMGQLWTLIILDEPGVVEVISLTDNEILKILMDSLLNDFNFGHNYNYKAGLNYSFSSSHPLYNGIFSVTVDSTSLMLASINGTTLHLGESEDSYNVILHLQVIYNSIVLEKTITIIVEPYTDNMTSNNPGSKGDLPYLDLTEIPGQFAGLLVERVERKPGFMGGTDMIVDLSFPDAYLIGATLYTLQYQDLQTLEWKNFIWYDEVPVQTSGNNFSIEMYENYKLRLLTDTGLTSNVVDVEYTSIQTYFAGWYLDQGMFLTGIMSPFVGCGLELGVVSIYNCDGTEVNNSYSVQWYRVNPISFEKTIIIGATNHFYTSTMDDVGYYLLVEVLGDNINAGGVLRVLTSETIKLKNSGYISSLSTDGFYLGFDYNLSINDLDNLLIYDQNQKEIEILNIQATSNPAVYYISCKLQGKDFIDISLFTQSFIMGKIQNHYFNYYIHTELRP